MNVAKLNVSQDAAREALLTYKAHRNVYDKRDWEIERIYRQIARGKKVISVRDSISAAGFDERNRPLLAIARADDVECYAKVETGTVWYSHTRGYSKRAFQLSIPAAVYKSGQSYSLRAAIPRIPPQHRPIKAELSNYHILWEADWEELPRDPMLLKRIGKDAWVVLAAWDLTDVEINVLRSQQ